MSGAIEVYWLGSSTSSLCTFLPTIIPLWQASLRITIEENGISSLGFPEFTRFFIPPYGEKLQLDWLQPTALPTELPGKEI
jgi:hypothetical protein